LTTDIYWIILGWPTLVLITLLYSYFGARLSLHSPDAQGAIVCSREVRGSRLVAIPEMRIKKSKKSQTKLN